jgi:hypothetical protein
LIAAAVGLALAFAVNAARADEADKSGMVIGVANNQVSIAPFKDDGSADRLATFSCASADAQKLLGRTPEAGDRVTYRDDPGKDAAERLKLRCSSLSPGKKDVDVGSRLIAIAIALVIVLGAACFAAQGDPLKFLIGADGRYSNSQCQLALWFGMAMTMYVAMVALRVFFLGQDFLDGVALTANVMTLTGLSALTFGAAKAVTGQKSNSSAADTASKIATFATHAAEANGVPKVTVDALRNAITKADSDKAVAVATQILTDGNQSSAVTAVVQAITDEQKRSAPVSVLATKPEPNLRTDLFQNDVGELDLGDFQMILIALAAAVIWGVSCFDAMATLPYQVHVSLPDVDSSLLAGFGIGQGAYLVKKAALPLGKG